MISNTRVVPMGLPVRPTTPELSQRLDDLGGACTRWTNTVLDDRGDVLLGTHLFERDAVFGEALTARALARVQHRTLGVTCCVLA